MGKIYVVRLISLLTLLVCLPASAYEIFESGGILFYTINGESVGVSSQRYVGDMVIPSAVTYNGKTYIVTTIPADQSDGNEPYTQLTSLVIPNSVTTIGKEAFGPCFKLRSLTIGSGVTSIGWGAFRGCTSLKTVISKIQKPFAINDVFLNLPSDAELIVPKGTKAAYQSTSGWNLFSKISEVDETDKFTENGIYYKLKSDGTLEVTGLASWTTRVDIPSSFTVNGMKYNVTSIGWRAFADRNDITYLSIPYSIKSIGEYAFIDCGNSVTVNIANLESWCKMELGNVHSSPFSSAGRVLLNDVETTSISIPETVTSIGRYTFYQCRSITSLYISGFVSSIGSSAFEDCTGLTSVTLSEGLTSIGGSSFEGCISLSSITIPSSVTSIALNAFKNCSNIKTVISEIQTPFAIQDNVFEGIASGAILTVPKGTKSLYQSMAGWNKFKNIVEDNSDGANFAINGVTYEGTKSSKTVVVKAVDTKQMSVEIPASVSYDGLTYQVTGITDDIFKGSSMGALIWNVDAALPNNAFSNALIGSNFLLYVKQTSFAPSSIKNVIANSTASSIVLSDDGGPFYCPQAFTARSISYTHNYSMETGGNGKGWETIALPFDVQRIVHNTRGEIVPFPSFNSSSNQKPFWLANFSGNGFRRTAAVLANEPYIIAMPNSSSYRNEYNLAGDVTFSADNVQVPKTPSFSGTFVPAFATVAKSSSVYALNVNNRHVKYSGNYDAGSRFISGLRDVRPFEAYISDSSTRGIYEINFDDGTTDMLDILLPTDEGQEVTIHTLSGQQMTRTTQRDFDAVWQQLPKGVYIINGKKWIK